VIEMARPTTTIARGRRTDQQLVETAVKDITRLWRRGLLDTVVAVGDYLIATFFDDDIAAALSHTPTKPTALRQLYARVDELPIGLHQLRVAIRVAVQCHQLPKALAHGLTPGHHEALLPLKQPAQRLKLARQTVQEQLTVRALEARVRALAPPRRGGRPPASPATRWARSMARVVDALPARELARLPQGELRALDDQLRQVEAGIAEARAVCARRLSPQLELVLPAPGPGRHRKAR
jgi:hypothetical protein